MRERATLPGGELIVGVGQPDRLLHTAGESRDGVKVAPRPDLLLGNLLPLAPFAESSCPTTTAIPLVFPGG